MPSSYTANLRFTLQATGENQNTWGNILNSGVFSLVDASIAGRYSGTLSGTVTLTTAQGAADQARNAILDFTGGTGGTVTVPAVSKLYFVRNNTSGDVVITTGGSTNATVHSGERVFVYSDGTNYYRLLYADMENKRLMNVATPTANGDAVNKQYADGLAFAATNLPGINAGTTDLYITNDGSAAYWAEVLPARSSGTANKVLKSLGTSDGVLDSTQWEWDGFQGISSKSSNYTVVLTDRSTWITCTAALTLALTAAATLGSKFIFRVINSATNANVTVDPNGAELINGASTLTIRPGETWDIACDGSAFTAVSVVQTPSGWDVIVQDQKASGTVGGTDATIGAYTTRTMNTVVRAAITGVALASNKVTLTAGTWLIKAFSPALTSSQRIAIYNTTDAAYSLVGPQTFSAALNATCLGTVEGYVTITAAKDFEVRQFRSSTPGADNLGLAIGSGDPEIYTQFFAQRVLP